MISAKIFSIFLCLFIFAASLSSQAEQFSFDGQVRYKKQDQNSFTDLPEGQSLPLQSGESALISTKQGLPVLIFSAENKKAEIHVDGTSLNNLVQEQLKSTLEKSTAEIIDGLRRTESLLQKRDYNQALATISPLKDRYKNISSVLFMSGTVFFLMNNKSAATEDLKKGLEIDPNNDAAKKLLQQMNGSAQ